MSPTVFMDNPFTAGINEIRSYWGRFLALGIIFVALGVACIWYSAVATTASLWVIGLLLMISAIVALVQAFWIHSWNGFFLFFLSALLRGVAGYLLIRYPHQGLVAVTMILASLFIVGGLFQLVSASLLRFPAWFWSMLSGAISLVLGIVVLAKMSETSVFFLGLVVGVNFVLDGAWCIALATELNKLPKMAVYKPKAA